MYVLYSFGTMAIPALGREQFVALYLTSGVVANLASHLYKTAVALPGLSLGAVSQVICFNYTVQERNIISMVFAESFYHVNNKNVLFLLVGSDYGHRLIYLHAVSRFESGYCISTNVWIYCWTCEHFFIHISNFLSFYYYYIIYFRHLKDYLLWTHSAAY